MESASARQSLLFCQFVLSLSRAASRAVSLAHSRPFLLLLLPLTLRTCYSRFLCRSFVAITTLVVAIAPAAGAAVASAAAYCGLWKETAAKSRLGLILTAQSPNIKNSDVMFYKMQKPKALPPICSKPSNPETQTLKPQSTNHSTLGLNTKP